MSARLHTLGDDRVDTTRRGARASSTDPTWSTTMVPTRCAGSTNAAASPQNSTSTGTASSRHTSSCSTTTEDQPSSANPARSTLAPKGRSVNARVRVTWARTADTDSPAEPTTPQPPASETAAANSAGAPSPNPTWRIGRRSPTTRTTPCAPANPDQPARTRTAGEPGKQRTRAHRRHPPPQPGVPDARFRQLDGISGWMRPT